jgi:hypothetical protein
MSKKIKITETQLKRLMENKEINEQQSLDEVGVGSIEMGLADEVAPMIADRFSEIDNIDALDMGIFTRALQHKVNELLRNRKEEPIRDIPGFEGTMDSLNKLSIRKNDMPSDISQMYEQKEQIKNEFKRFL